MFGSIHCTVSGYLKCHKDKCFLSVCICVTNMGVPEFIVSDYLMISSH